MTKKVLNASGMKSANQKKILDMLRVASVSRAELARKTGLTRASISGIVDELMGKGIVVEGELLPKKVGRRSIEVKLNGERYLIGGVAISRDYCTVGISDLECQILMFERILFESGKENPLVILHKAAEIISQMCLRQGRELLGIGITAPGTLDILNGKIMSPPNFEKWHNLNVCGFFEEKFNCLTVLENNAKAITLAEMYCKGGRFTRNYVEVVVDYGIGGGIIIGGKLYEGNTCSSGEFGHTTVDINGQICSCGNRGCAELYAAIPNIIAYAQSFDASVSKWEEIVDRAQEGEPDMVKVFDREVDCLVAVIVNAVNVIDPESVFIGGDILYKEEYLTEKIQEKVNRRIMRRAIKEIPVYPSQIKEHKRLVPCVNLLLSYAIDKSCLWKD